MAGAVYDKLQRVTKRSTPTAPAAPRNTTPWAISFLKQQARHLTGRLEDYIMYGVIHTNGSGEDNPPFESLPRLYDELLSADREHGDVSVIDDESGWCMSAHRDGRLVFTNLARRGARHMMAASKERVVQLWIRLINGNIDELFAEPWQDGYGT
jgi:hypothetical protein